MTYGTRIIYVKVVNPRWSAAGSFEQLDYACRTYFETITDGNLVDYWYCGAIVGDGRYVERYGIEVRE